MEGKKPSILVVDDELSIRESFSLILEDAYNVILAASGEASLKKVADEKIDLVYLDIRMPGLDGMETLKRMKEIDKDLEIIMVTAVNDVQKAGEAVKLGAVDYVVKPFDVDDILNMTKSMLERKALGVATKEIRGEAARRGIPVQVIGSSRRMEEIANIIETVAKKDTPVLITGEKGVEVELIASVIHEKSERYLKPFRIVDMGTKPETILREIFFGRSSGSFIFAIEQEKGIFEEAREGTILLSSIEAIPFPLQAELALVIEKKEIKREGAATPIPIDIRIISYSALSLKELVKEGTFNKDLYNLISETLIELPPLRERSEDISQFVAYFLEIFNLKYNKRIKGFTKEAMEVLTDYSWPGNVRELEEILERLTIITEEEFISLSRIPIDILLQSPAYFGTEESKELTFEVVAKNFEKEFLTEILKRVNFDLSSAAKILGLKPTSLSTKLESLGLK